MREEALADRADLMFFVLVAYYRNGRFADVSRLIHELEVLAKRAGHHATLLWTGVTQSVYQLNLTGDLQAFLEHLEIAGSQCGRRLTRHSRQKIVTYFARHAARIIS